MNAMKREYAKPQVEVTEVQPLIVIANSLAVGGGETNEQNAPAFDGVEWSWE